MSVEAVPHPGDAPKRCTKAFAVWQRAVDAWARSYRERIEHQRALFAANLGPARVELQEAMLYRAWALLEAGEGEAADALLEFVPEAAAVRLLDEFFPEDLAQ
jgi:hypothetical protein